MAYLLKKKGFNDVTILEKTNRLGGQIDSADIRGTTSTWHIWNWEMYSKTLLPLLVEFGFGPQMVNISRDYFQFWPINDDSVSYLLGSVAKKSTRIGSPV